MFGIDDEMYVPLPMQGHILRAVPSHGGQAHTFKQAAQMLGLRSCVLDELETIGAHRIGGIHDRLPKLMRYFITI